MYVPKYDPLEDEVTDRLNIENQICSAVVEKVTSFGEMFVRFNTDMMTEDLDLAMLNTTLIDIYVIPSGKRASFSSFNLS